MRELIGHNRGKLGAYKFKYAALLLALSVAMAGCSRQSSKLPVIYTFAGLKTGFTNQSGAYVFFPSAYRGKIVVMSYIYTHCPDICPMTTNNMQSLQKMLASDGEKNVRFVTLTFDPSRDTPGVLKDYAQVRGIAIDDWDFLSGPKANVDSVLGRIRMKYVMTDSSYSKGHELTYFINHSDECVLVDTSGNVRGVYSGSQLDFKQIIGDIKSLE